MVSDTQKVTFDEELNKSEIITTAVEEPSSATFYLPNVASDFQEKDVKTLHAFTTSLCNGVAEVMFSVS